MFLFFLSHFISFTYVRQLKLYMTDMTSCRHNVFLGMYSFVYVWHYSFLPLFLCISVTT